MKKSGDTAHLRAIDDTIIVAYCTIGYRSGMLAQRIRKAILDSPVLCLANPTAQDFGHWQIADAYTDDRGSKTEDDNAGDESDASDNASQDDGESKCHAAENKSTGIHVYNLDSGILAYTHTNGPLLYRGGGLCVNETTGTNAADNKNGSNSKGNDKMNGKDSSKDNGSEHADSNRRDKDAGVNGCSRSNSENSENKTGKHDLKEWHEGGGTGEITTKTSTHFQTILDGIAKRDARALPTKRLHVYGKRWNLAAEGYESVYFRHPILKFAWTFVKGALSTFGW